MTSGRLSLLSIITMTTPVLWKLSTMSRRRRRALPPRRCSLRSSVTHSEPGLARARLVRPAGGVSVSAMHGLPSSKPSRTPSATVQIHISRLSLVAVLRMISRAYRSSCVTMEMQYVPALDKLFELLEVVHRFACALDASAATASARSAR